MVSISTFRQLALALKDAEGLQHFDKPSFRLKGKIFATLWEAENRAMLKLSLIDQSVFCSYGDAVFFPVPGGWGRQGATFVDLKKVRKDMLKDALDVAYRGVIAPKLKKKN